MATIQEPHIVTRSLQKWGNGTGVRLPQSLLKAANLANDQLLEVYLQGDSVVLKPIKPKASKKKTLAELLESVTPENTHGEVDWGAPQGKEIW